MKYDVTFSCGHTHTVELFGKTSDRERRIKWYEECGVCPDCYKEQKEIEMSITHDEVEMSYRQYKTEYANCKTKPGSYNGNTKTIIVYVPKAKKSKEKKMVWIVSYALNSGCMVHNEGFDEESEARKFFDKMKDCPYCEIYQTEDIWS